MPNQRDARATARERPAGTHRGPERCQHRESRANEVGRRRNCPGQIEMHCPRTHEVGWRPRAPTCRRQSPSLATDDGGRRWLFPLAICVAGLRAHRTVRGRPLTEPVTLAHRAAPRPEQAKVAQQGCFLARVVPPSARTAAPEIMSIAPTADGAAPGRAPTCPCAAMLLQFGGRQPGQPEAEPTQSPPLHRQARRDGCR